VGVISAGKLMKGFFVTSGVFSPEATEFASKVPQLELIDGADLLVMFGALPKVPGSRRAQTRQTRRIPELRPLSRLRRRPQPRRLTHYTHP